MKERPILFAGEMVRAILDGKKSQTRRVIKPQPAGSFDGPQLYAPTKIDRHGEEYPGPEVFGIYCKDGEWGTRCHYGQPGDHLWVRERAYCDDQNAIDRRWKPRNRFETNDWLDAMYYRADGDCCTQIAECACAEVGKPKWRPSIHMPRWASRITLAVKAVRVERVQEISPEDCIEEGIEREEHLANCSSRLRPRFQKLWDSINAKRGYSWESNPWVWVVEFKRVAA